MLLARWIVRSVPLEIVGSSEYEKVPTRGIPVLKRPGRPRGERIEGSCGKHLWTPKWSTRTDVLRAQVTSRNEIKKALEDLIKDDTQTPDTRVTSEGFLKIY
ncbi:hypothetical protein TNCV_4773611 [Trichonephila clavipes]|nr:hypothetical protein TNCV_4773611 [Trichonephila clavipes]